MLRNRAKRKYGTVAQEIQFSKFYRTAIFDYKRPYWIFERAQRLSLLRINMKMEGIEGENRLLLLILRFTRYTLLQQKLKIKESMSKACMIQRNPVHLQCF